MFGYDFDQDHKSLLAGELLRVNDDDTQRKPDDLAATIYHALGIDTQIEYYTSTGRPVLLVPDGKVMTEVFA